MHDVFRILIGIPNRTRNSITMMLKHPYSLCNKHHTVGNLKILKFIFARNGAVFIFIIYMSTF